MASAQNPAEKDNVSEYEDAKSNLDNVSTTGTLDGMGKGTTEEHRDRDSFGSKTSYLLTLVGYAVGFGNLWRFPYRLQTYGGVFLIPYTISVIFLGLPVFYLELAIGQRLRKGPVGAWNEVSSYLGGIGITSGCICFFLAFYYNTLVAYCISYFVDSFRETLPWHDCETALASRVVGSDPSECFNASNPSKYYWFRGVLDVSPEIEDLGGFRWELYLCLLLAWFFVGFILIKGLEFTGKIVYFTACFPYVVLFIFLIFGWTLHGMDNGYKQMFTFDFSHLLNGRIWKDAASQIFFSLGVGYGVLISYSSTLPAKNNVWIDAIIVTTVNCSTSILSCCVVFGILGFRGTENYEQCNKDRALAIAAEKSNIAECLTITEYITESGVGSGLAFISFAEAIKKLPIPQLFNFLFFLMLMTLGIDSSFGTVEGLIASLLDLFPKLRRWMVASFCVWLLSLFCILFAFGWGNHVLTILDNYSIDYSLLVISFMECVAVGWFYGLGKFSYDLQLMTGRRPNLYLLICIKYLIPVVMLALIIVNVVQQITEKGSFQYSPWNKTTASDSEGIDYPTRSVVIAFLVVVFCIFWMPLVAILRAVKKPFIKPSVPEEFPENELRQESGFDLHPHLRHISGAERILFGTSVHDFPSAGGKMDEGLDKPLTGSGQEIRTGSTVNVHQPPPSD